MTDWWTGIPAAATSIECGGHAHTLRWDQGELTAVEHDVPMAEATLAALARGFPVSTGCAHGIGTVTTCASSPSPRVGSRTGSMWRLIVTFIHAHR